MGQKPSRGRPAVSLTWMLRQGGTMPCDPFVNKCLEANAHMTKGRRVLRDPGRRDGLSQVCDRRAERIVGRSAKQFSFPQTTITRNLDENSFRQDKHPDCRDCERKHTRRKKRTKNQSFGYEISDVDLFLTQATIDSPGNIPVVVIYPCILYETHTGTHQRELPLSPGMVVNAVFKNQQWLYVQTPHGDEGYALGASCIPLGILPIRRSKSASAATPCWESTVDLYPKPCGGNMTDNEKEHLRGGTKSECGYERTKLLHYDTMSMRSERTFDKLYLKVANGGAMSVASASTRRSSSRRRCVTTTRRTLMVVVSDFEGSKLLNTLSVRKGEVVVLVDRGDPETDVDSEWFYVRNKSGCEGFIPATVAGYGYL